tara:strand:+ start:4954 stop:5403 length:450 start_codon:yes stop_codon:yes gene_type:complete
VKKGYLRRLQGKKYPVPRRQPGRFYTARFQILYNGASTKLPTYEQFISQKPRVVQELDEHIPDLTYKGRGVRGVEAKSVAQAFCSGVSSASGQHRILENQLEMAKTLVNQGVTAEMMHNYAIELTKLRLAQGQQPPISINQVVTYFDLT